MINCFKDSIHVLMSVLLSTNDDDDHDAHEEVVDHEDGHRVNDVFREEDADLVDGKEDEGQNGGDTIILRSSLRRADSNSSEAEKRRKKKRKVQWVDMVGIQDLAEIREFEPSEEDEMDSDRGKTCVCVIL
jgi:hypothetical protein